ncbi:MAG: COG4223 family protein [Paracoccaceae bacterium]
MADKKNSDQQDVDKTADTPEKELDINTSDAPEIDGDADEDGVAESKAPAEEADELDGEVSKDGQEDAPDEMPDEMDALIEEIETSDPIPETEPVPTQTAEATPKSRGGLGAGLLGGVAGAALVILLGQTGVLSSFLPEARGVAEATAAIEILEAEQSALRDQLAQLSAQLDAGADLTPLTSGISDLSGRLDVLEGDISRMTTEVIAAAALAERLATLEKRPIANDVSDEAIAAYEAEMTRLTEALIAQRAEVERMVEDAKALDAESTEAARVASAQTAIARMKVKLDTGESIGGVLSELSGLGVQTPAALGTATDGVATLQALTGEFTPAARDALAAARKETAGTGGLSGFINRHLNARSVAPREGADPDAILSRAQAAVGAGDLATALTEISDLPDSARAPLADWEKAAQLRLDALNAADELAQSLNSN